MARYYSERAQAGLIITEGTSPSMNGLTGADMPGLFEPEHVVGWKQVTQLVHKKGGKIFVQLMHCGRAAHLAYQPEGARLLAPSARALGGTLWVEGEGEVNYPVPIAMSEVDMSETIAEFVHASRQAILAGFDGVEVHAANGYLIDQFLNRSSNVRNDNWGGSVENRIRFAVEVVQSIAQAIGPDRVGMRISPFGQFNGMSPDPEMENLYLSLIDKLNLENALYVHIVDRAAMGAPAIDQSIKTKIRQLFKGRLILSGGYDKALATQDLLEQKGDLIAFGRPFISNPNLVEKLKNNLPLLPPNYDQY